MAVEPAGTVLSKRKGLLLFILITSVLAVLFIFASRSTVSNTVTSKTPIPTSSKSPSVDVSQAPTVEPAPALTYPADKLSIDNNAAAERAIIIATKLSYRDWNDSATVMLGKIQEYVDPDYFTVVSEKVNSFDLNKCVKSHCVVLATKGLTKLDSKAEGELDVTQVILRYDHYTKPMPSLTWKIHMQFQGGQWYATSIKGPGF